MISPRLIDVDCTVDVAQTVESLHAHVELDGLDVMPGDEVLVHHAPTDVAYGEHLVCKRRATVTRASALRRLLTRLTSRFELTLLYELSFSPARGHNAPTKRQR